MNIKFDKSIFFFVSFIFYLSADPRYGFAMEEPQKNISMTQDQNPDQKTFFKFLKTLPDQTVTIEDYSDYGTMFEDVHFSYQKLFLKSFTIYAGTELNLHQLFRFDEESQRLLLTWLPGQLKHLITLKDTRDQLQELAYLDRFLTDTTRVSQNTLQIIDAMISLKNSGLFNLKEINSILFDELIHKFGPEIFPYLDQSIKLLISDKQSFGDNTGQKLIKLLMEQNSDDQILAKLNLHSEVLEIRQNSKALGSVMIMPEIGPYLRSQSRFWNKNLFTEADKPLQIKELTSGIQDENPKYSDSFEISAKLSSWMRLEQNTLYKLPVPAPDTNIREIHIYNDDNQTIEKGVEISVYRDSADQYYLKFNSNADYLRNSNLSLYIKTDAPAEYFGYGFYQRLDSDMISKIEMTLRDIRNKGGYKYSEYHCGLRSIDFAKFLSETYPEFEIRLIDADSGYDHHFVEIRSDKIPWTRLDAGGFKQFISETSQKHRSLKVNLRAEPYFGSDIFYLKDYMSN